MDGPFPCLWTWKRFLFFLLKPSADLSVLLPPQQPLTVWWAHGAPGRRAHLHAEWAARSGAARCPFPPETEARPAPTSNSAGDASETTPYAARPKVRGFFLRVPTRMHSLTHALRPSTLLHINLVFESSLEYHLRTLLLKGTHLFWSPVSSCTVSKASILLFSLDHFPSTDSTSR